MRKIIKSKSDLQECIKELNSLDVSKEYVFEVKPFKKNRSLKQNALMWMYFRCIKDETGNDVDTLYEYFCEKFLPWSEKELFGNCVRMVGGTSQLNTKEFDDFLENIRMEMLHMNIILPNPDDQGWDEFYAKYCGG